MIFLVVFYVFLSTLSRIQSNTVTSPQIRILDVATKASETRVIPHRVEYQNSFHPNFYQQNRYDQNTEVPLKSYVIYDEYPLKIFKEWKANPPTEFSSSGPQNHLDFIRQPNTEFSPVYYFQNGQEILPQPKPTLAYSSVYSNVIKVFEDSLNSLDRNRFQSEKYIKPFEENVWKSQNPTEYESVYSQENPRRQLYHSFKLPDNFPKVFSPNDKFHFPSFDEVRQPPKFFYPQEGFYDTYTINYNRENTRHRNEVEILPEVVKQKNQKKPVLCSFIRVNQRQFPENKGPCARSDDDLPLIPLEYPDFSGLPDDKIPVEHRRQHFQIKRIKRSELNESYESRKKRNAGFGYGYSGWSSPFNYENGYEGYFSDHYPSRESYRNSNYYSNRNRNQNYRSRYYSGSRYDDYEDDYQNNDGSNSGGLSGYLTNGGRRYKNRKNNNDDDDEDYDDNNNNDNNRDNDSNEEMERMNSNRRDTNDRRNNDDSRDRRRNNNNNNNNNNNSNNNNNNNNNNDDDDYRDNRRNNNRNNSRRYNNNRRNNDRYDNNNNNNNNNNNSNRNRYYSNSNGYNNNNGYGSGYGSYGSNYGGYGSGGFGNGGYGSGYGSNGGYGYGGYGNGFGSF